MGLGGAEGEQGKRERGTAGSSVFGISTEGKERGRAGSQFHCCGFLQKLWKGFLAEAKKFTE